jgi:hypothetical protein
LAPHLSLIPGFSLLDALSPWRVESSDSEYFKYWSLAHCCTCWETDMWNNRQSILNSSFLGALRSGQYHLLTFPPSGSTLLEGSILRVASVRDCDRSLRPATNICIPVITNCHLRVRGTTKSLSSYMQWGLHIGWFILHRVAAVKLENACLWTMPKLIPTLDKQES